MAMRMWALPPSPDEAAETKFRSLTSRFRLAPTDSQILRRELQRASPRLAALAEASRNSDPARAREVLKQIGVASQEVWDRLIEFMTADGRRKMRAALDNLKRGVMIYALDLSNVDAKPPTETISTAGSRPLSGLLLQLEKRHGWQVTYEDAYYDQQGDLMDITSAAQNAVDPTVSSEPGRTLIFNYLPADVARPEAVLANLVGTYNQRSEEHQYQLLRQGSWFHVIPASSKDANGITVLRQSRLDVRVTIADTQRTVEKTIEAILDAVNRSSQTRISANAPRVDVLAQKSVRMGAHNEIARDVLIRALQATGRKVTWHLLCDATAQCAFNVRVME
jgi:hypothetical protein